MAKITFIIQKNEMHMLALILRVAYTVPNGGVNPGRLIHFILRSHSMFSYRLHHRPTHVQGPVIL